VLVFEYSKSSHLISLIAEKAINVLFSQIYIFLTQFILEENLTVGVPFCLLKCILLTHSILEEYLTIHIFCYCCARIRLKEEVKKPFTDLRNTVGI